MSRSKESSLKKARESKKRNKQKAKEEKREARKANSNKGKGFDSMIAYVDHRGHLSDTPPDETMRPAINTEEILLGARPRIDEEPSFSKGKISYINEDKG